MKFVLSFLAFACLVVAPVYFVRRVHAQSAVAQDGVRITVDGNKLIRVEPATVAPSALRTIKRLPEDIRTVQPARGPILPDLDTRATHQDPVSDSRPKLLDGELVRDSQQSVRPAPRLVRKPDPSQGFPEVTW